MQLDKNTKRSMEDVFREYTDPETMAFNKTHVLVQLAQLNEEEYISRSQAKRVLNGLDKFGHIVLDFKGVKTVGQAFVDEVFRVFQNEHPEIKIEPINMDANVTFMVTRGLSPAR